jgi:hypothetical protein
MTDNQHVRSSGLRRSAARALAVLALAVIVSPSGGAQSESDEDIQVHAKKNGQEVTVEVDCPVPPPLAIAWEVLTDYDHMAEFLSDVQSSRVQAREGLMLQVYQKGRAARGLLSTTFENLREVELVPYSEIRSRLISGDLKASNFTTRLVNDGTLVHIVHSSRYTPKIWVPPLIGPALIEAETRKHFGELRDEIVRRSALRAKVPSAALPSSAPPADESLASDAPR